MNNKTKISSKEAAELLGCSSRNIQNLIKKGKISASRDDSGAYIIDLSEFYRVFPDIFDKRNDAKNVTQTREKEIEYLNKLLQEKEKQLEILLKQLEISTNEKGILLETLSSSQKLLEHQSSKNKRKKFLGVF